jgi:hypothetical protein
MTATGKSPGKTPHPIIPNVSAVSISDLDPHFGIDAQNVWRGAGLDGGPPAITIRISVLTRSMIVLNAASAACALLQTFPPVG